MKTYLTILALFAGVAGGPGSALAAVWHCIATPPGVPDDQHGGYAHSRDEAASRAMHKCKADHDDCVILDCHIDHY